MLVCCDTNNSDNINKTKTAVVVSNLYAFPEGVKSFVNGNQAIKTGLTGAAAGSVQVATLMWLRTITSYQSSYDVSFLEAVNTLYADGGLERFYRGISFALVQGPLSRFGSITANSLAEGLLDGNETYLAWLDETLRQLPIAPDPAVGPASAATELEERGMVGGALTALTTQYRRLYHVSVDGVLAICGTAIRQLSPAAVGSALSGIWRVLLMPLDTLKVLSLCVSPLFCTLVTGLCCVCCVVDCTAGGRHKWLPDSAAAACEFRRCGGALPGHAQHFACRCCGSLSMVLRIQRIGCHAWSGRRGVDGNWRTVCSSTPAVECNPRYWRVQCGGRGDSSTQAGRQSYAGYQRCFCRSGPVAGDS